MRPFATLAFAALSLTGVLASKSSENQVVLPDSDGANFKPGWSYTDCGLPEDIIQIDSIQVTPDPPQPGKDLTVKVTATALDRIEEGAYADVTVKLGLIKLLKKTFDLCEEARNANASVTCPVEPGPYTVEHTVKLPREIPRAKFNVEVLGFTDQDEDMLCLHLTVDFTPSIPFPRLW